MALSSKLVTITAGTGVVTTTYNSGSLGFEPKVVIVQWNGRTDGTDAAGSSNHQRGYGFAVSSTSRRSVASHSQDAQAAAVARMGVHEEGIVMSLLSGGGIDGVWDIVFNADDFDLVVDDQSTIALVVQCLVLGGDIAGEIVNIVEPADVGDQDTTSLAIDPSAVFFIWNNAAAAAPSTSNDSRVGCGAAAGATPANALWAGGSNTAAVTTQTMAYCRADECLTSFDTGVTALQAHASVTAWLTGGFRLNWTERSNTSRFYYALGLTGVDMAVVELLTEDDTSTDIVLSGLSFPPTAGIFVSSGRAESAADTPEDHDEWSSGMFDASTQLAISSHDEDNVADSEVATAIEYDSIYANLDAGDALEGLAHITSYDSGGLTLRMTDADPVPAFVWGLLFGVAGAAAPVTVAPQTGLAFTGGMGMGF